jgi:hypothetical protein
VGLCFVRVITMIFLVGLMLLSVVARFALFLVRIGVARVSMTETAILLCMNILGL